MPIKEKGNNLDRLIGAMKTPPGKGGARHRGQTQQQETVLASMEVDTPLYSRIKSFPSSRKRLNVDYPEESLTRRAMDEPTMATPSPQANGTRTPARLRLSVSRKRSGSFKFRGNRIQDYQDDAAGGTPDAGAAAEDLEEEDPETRRTAMMIMREEFPLTDRKRALFEPLGPTFRGPRDGEDESMVPPPDFESASYPRGWVVGKKRKLVNVDVVESMRRIAVHEMNRKDREINGLNEQLEEDSRTMEHLQLQLQQERTKRQQAERENSMLQGQVNMLMNMINEAEEADDEDIHG